jgi:hypothetical protein
VFFGIGMSGIPYTSELRATTMRGDAHAVSRFAVFFLSFSPVPATRRICLCFIGFGF